MNTIKGFFREYRFLSNFYQLPAPIVDEFESVYLSYSTVEHAYQAMKSLNPNQRREIALAETPGSAKRKGTRVALRGDWGRIKDDIMMSLVRRKFYDNPDLARRLVATGDAEIYEVNHWGDLYWGCDEFLEGENRLGQILMQVRDELAGQF